MVWKREILAAVIGGIVAAAAVFLLRQPEPETERQAAPPFDQMGMSQSDKERWNAHIRQGGLLVAEPPVQDRFSDAKQGDGVYMELRLGMVGSGERSTMSGAMLTTGKAWLSKDRIRLERIGASGLQTTIVNSEGTFQLLPTQKKALHTRTIREQRPDNRAVSFSIVQMLLPFEPKKRLMNPRVIGSDRLLGIDCSIWSGETHQVAAHPLFPQQARSSGSMKFWAPKSGAPPFPLKAFIKMKGGDDVGGEFRVTRLDLGQAIPDSRFEIPADYTIQWSTDSPQESAEAPQAAASSDESSLLRHTDPADKGRAVADIASSAGDK